VSQAAWKTLLGRTPLRHDIEAQLRAHMQWRAVLPGEAVFSHLEPARELVILAQGDAALGRKQADGSFHTERSVHGPAWLDASSAWLEGAHLQDAVALSPCQVVGVPSSALQAVLLDHPALAPQLLASQGQQVHTLIEVIHDLMHKDAEGRFAAWLLQRCSSGGSDASGDDADAATVTLHERKRDIAAQLAITPETLSRLLRQLKRKGLIDVLGYTVRVLDVPRLRALAAV
jgi:CRP/FNR family transcriptional regulator, dissimilatory nitrate respiration regulator